jgi:ankyrin repeat protein
VDFLLDLGASAASQEDVNERNLLHKLCIQGGTLIEQEPTIARSSPVDPSLETITLIEILLKHSSNLTSQSDILHRKPLHYAAMYGFSRIVAALLDHSVANGEYSDQQNFTSRFWVDHEGYSPLFYAILNGRTAATKVLIQRGEIKDIDNALNRKYLMTDQVYYSYTEFVTASTTFEEFNIETQDASRSSNFPHDSWRQSPLAIACKGGNAKLTALLIEVGANLEMRDEDGETPLYFAARNGHVDCIEELLKDPKRKADVNVQDTVNGYTPLMVAGKDE